MPVAQYYGEAFLNQKLKKNNNKINHQGRSCSSNLVTTYYVAMSNMERKDILLLPLFYSC